MERIKEEKEANGRRQLPTPMVWGAIGIGKSVLIRDATDKVYGEDAIYVDWRLSTCEPTDLLGIPKIENGTTIFCPPSKFPIVGKGVLHFDEINLAPLAVQHSAYQLLLDGKLGYYTLPKTFQIIASGNEKEHRAGVYDIPAPLMNRMIHLKLVEPKTEFGNLADWREDWVNWAIGHGIDTRVTTYIYQHPAKLYDFDPRKVERSFASPRSWEFTSVRIKGLKELERVEKACNSTIGAKMTQDFIAFLKIGQEFNVENIFRYPKQFKTAGYEVDVQFFLTSAIVDYVGIAYGKLKVEEKKNALLDTFCYLMSQFPEEFQVLMCKLVYGFKDIYEALLQKDSPLTKYVTDRLFKLLFAKVG